MLEAQIETLSAIVYAFTQIADRSPQYKALCSECIVELERVKYDLASVGEFIQKASAILGDNDG
jgi:hypothetical protein